MVNTAKKALRKKVLDNMGAVTFDTRMRESDFICEAVQKSPLYKAASRVGLFISMPQEIQTQSLISAALKDNKQVFVPKVTGREMALYSLVSSIEIDDFRKTKWGIPEPDPMGRESFDEVAFDTDDLMIVPCVAFNKDGKRLGHGGGFYDKFLRRLNDLRAQKDISNIRTLGIALSCQLVVDDIPVDSHDVLIDRVFTFPG